MTPIQASTESLELHTMPSSAPVCYMSQILHANILTVILKKSRHTRPPNQQSLSLCDYITYLDVVCGENNAGGINWPPIKVNQVSYALCPANKTGMLITYHSLLWN